MAISPVTFDVPREGDDLATTDPLITIVGNEYFLKRIVGKLHAEVRGLCGPNNAGGTARCPAVLFGAGFFVARAADSAVGGGPNLPIGAASLAEQIEHYSPLSEDTIREPWIWRRVWTLSNFAVAKTTGTAGVGGIAQLGGENFPTSTSNYGSVADGPHIDAKTARRIRQDERLWFVVAAANWPESTLNNDGDLSNDLRGYLDFRLLGAMRRARQRSAF